MSEKVDLARSGLTGITDVRAVLASIQPLEPVRLTPPPNSNPVTEFRTGKGGGSSRGRLIALGVVLVIAAVVAVLVLFVLNPMSDNTTAPNPANSADTNTVEPGVGKISLSGPALVIPPDGSDRMLAVTGLPNGNVVAVGASATRQPRAWLSKDKADFASVNVPVDEQGEVLDVTTVGSTVVAVGWTGVGPANRAAVWTSVDGSKWDLLPAQGEFNPPSGIKRLTAVTVGPDNKLLAIGRDDRTDRADGDAAVYTSADGKTWTPVQSTGLSGSGPQDVVRLAVAADNSYVAIGSVLDGAGLGPAIWTSKDGVKWEASAFTPEGTVSLQGIARLSDGRLMICGSIGSGTPPRQTCWTQKPDQHWERWDVATEKGAPRALQLSGMYPVPGNLVAIVGLGQSTGADNKNTNDAAIWTATFGPRS